MAENAVPKFNVEAFNPKKAELASLVEKYKGLKINGVEDKEGYEKVRKARIELKNTRCDIKNKLKEARDPAIAFQNAVLALESDLIGIIEPTEDALEAEEKRIDSEKERIKREAEEKERQRLQAMVDKLAAVGYPSSVQALKGISEADFETLLADVTKRREEANRAQAEAAAKAEAERKKLEEEKAAVEAQRKANEEAAAKIEAEKKAIEEEREAMKRETSGIPEELPPSPPVQYDPPELSATSTDVEKPSTGISFRKYLGRRFAESYCGSDDSGPDAEASWLESLTVLEILDFMATWYETTNDPDATVPFDDYDKVEGFVRQIAGI